ncbi:MAG TPA: hypothetical protein VND68_03170 [Chloroflexia bacterium]|nr:hypothetical protein [Chloroflexia bacterium]
MPATELLPATAPMYRSLSTMGCPDGQFAGIVTLVVKLPTGP